MHWNPFALLVFLSSVCAKEFEATHPVYKGVNRQQVQRVDGRIAGVIGGRYTLTCEVSHL